MSKASYSLEGEDLILGSLLRGVSGGTFIDVGANHPVSLNNTYGLYLAGWTGLAVDGNSSFAPLWEEYRPRDRFVQSLVSDSVREVEFRIFPDDTMSSMDVETSKRYGARFDSGLVRVETVTTSTLDQLVQREIPGREIHLLSVDVEGEDLNVLMGARLSVMVPGVVVVETKHCSLHEPFDHPIVEYLCGMGYRLIAKTPLDAFFVLPEKAYLDWIPRSLL